MENSSEFKWFIEYFSIFFVTLIIGTLIHELGHYIVAVIYGVPAQISYAYTHYFGSLTEVQRFWFLMGGPLSSWLVSTTGIIIILVKYKYMHKESEKSIGVGQSISIVGTSFSIRFIFNAGFYFINTTLGGITSNADEAKIAQEFLGINPDILMYGSAIIALVFIIVALYYIPSHQRYIILVGGIIGGILGYIFWNYWFGPIILPPP
ncbi:MAG: hypothetical protein ACFFCV_03565 [Promethearchaeota archaeon]